MTVDLQTILLGVLALFLLTLYSTRYNPRGVFIIPGLPFLQNTVEVLANFDRVIDFLVEKFEKHNTKTLGFKTLLQPAFIYTVDPANVEYILKTKFEDFPKGPEFHSRFKELLGNGIFNVDGDEWYTLRKVSTRMFNVRNFRDHMVSVFSRHCDEVAERIREVPTGKSFDLQDLFLRFTLDSMGEVGFGKDIGSMHDPTVPFATSFDFCQQNVTRRFFEPLWGLREALTPNGWAFKAALKRLDDYALEIVRSRRADTELENKGDLLSLFMGRTREDGSAFDDKFLRDLVMNFLIAGRDTTANALSWTFYCVSQHPSVEARLVAEVDAAFAAAAEAGHPGTLSYDQINKELRYTQAVFDETLRLYPSVPQDGKWVEKGATLPDGTVIPPKTWVGYFPYGMGRQETLWTDAKRFNPDRWLSGGTRPSPFVYPVFNAGPRTCLGQNMAYLEAKLAMAQLYRQFKFRLVEGQTVTYATSVTLIMKNPLLMTVVPRHHD